MDSSRKCAGSDASPPPGHAISESGGMYHGPWAVPLRTPGFNVRWLIAKDQKGGLYWCPIERYFGPQGIGFDWVDTCECVPSNKGPYENRLPSDSPAEHATKQPTHRMSDTSPQSTTGLVSAAQSRAE